MGCICYLLHQQLFLSRRILSQRKIFERSYRVKAYPQRTVRRTFKMCASCVLNKGIGSLTGFVFAYGGKRQRQDKFSCLAHSKCSGPSIRVKQRVASRMVAV